jgi:hypothetical protein
LTRWTQRHQSDNKILLRPRYGKRRVRFTMFKTNALLFLAFQPAGAAHSRQQQAPADLSAQLSMRVDTYNLHAGSFVEALAQVAGEFKIPMGIVWIDKPSARGNLSFSWVGATVQEIVQEVVTTQFGYRLEVGNGIVRVFPSEIPSNQNFLNVRINQFAVHREVLPVATRELKNQVRMTVSPPKDQSNVGTGSSLAANTDEPIIDFQSDHSTVEEILNSLISISDRKIWIVTFEDSFILTSTGLRRTLSLWSDLPVPDDEQPVWDMFRWGAPIPTKALGGK